MTAPNRACTGPSGVGQRMATVVHRLRCWLRLTRHQRITRLHSHRADLPTLRPLGAEDGRATESGLP